MKLISKDDGGEEVEQMPEIDLSSDSEGEVQCIEPQLSRLGWVLNLIACTNYLRVKRRKCVLSC